MRHLFNIIAILSVLVCGGSIYAEEQTNAGDPAKQSGRPEHTLEMSYTGYSGDRQDHSRFNARLDNRLFSFGNNSALSSSLKYSRVDIPEEKDLPGNVTDIGGTLNFQSLNYTAFIMVNSPSDKPFHSRHEVRIISAAGKKIWHDNTDSLWAMVLVMNIKLWGHYFPIPFINYTHAQENLFLALGLPAIISWKIHSKLRYNLTYFIPLNVNSTLMYSPAAFLGIGPEIDFKQESYYIADRPDNDTVFYNRYFTAGVKAEGHISSCSSIVVSCGYVPYGKYFYSDSFFEMHRVHNRDKGFFIKGAIRVNI